MGVTSLSSFPVRVQQFVTDGLNFTHERTADDDGVDVRRKCFNVFPLGYTETYGSRDSA